MSIIPDRRASDQAMGPEKRPAEATEPDPTEPEKRLRVTKFTELIFSEHYELLNPKGKGKDDYLKAQVLDSSDEKPEGKDLTPVQKHIHSLLSGTTFSKVIPHFLPSGTKTTAKVKMIPEFFTEEPLPAIIISDNKDAHDKDALVAGDSSTQIIQEKPEAAGDDSTPIIQEKPEDVVGDFPTENDTDKLAYCFRCKKDTDHIPARCPSRPRLPNYCMVCNGISDHSTSNCPNATEDLLEKLAYCMLCDKNTDHDTFGCPDKETGGFVWYQGAYLPNVCDLCHKRGHVGEECPLSDSDDYDPPGSDEDW